MRLSENRVIAWVVLVVCVVGSVSGLGGASMARERTDILEVFHEGADDRDNTHCMSAYLERAIENARVMANEVYLIHNDDWALNDLTVLLGLDSEAGAYENMPKLKHVRELADEMYNYVYAAELTDTQRRDFKIAYDDFQGAIRMMEKDPYLELAKEFNDDLTGSFIARGVCSLLGIESLSEGF